MYSEAGIGGENDDVHHTGFRRVLQYLYAISDRSSEVSACIEHLTTHIIRSGFTCVGGGIQECGDNMRSFVRSMIRNLLISGYAVYRIDYRSRKRKRNKEDEEPIFMVARGDKVIIKYDVDTNQWLPEISPGSQETDRVYDDWKVVVLCTPRLSRPDSYVYAARFDIVRIERLVQAYVDREMANSEHRVLTQIDNQQGTTESGRPWFAMAIPNSGATTDELMQARLNFVRETASITAELRRNMGTDRVGAGFESTRREAFHKESMVTDGMTVAGHPLNTLHGSPDFRAMLNRLRANVLNMMGVPPSELGEQVQSERVGGSQVIVNQSLLLFRDRIQRLRSIFSPILVDLGLQFRVNVSLHVLPEVLPLVKTDRAVELISLAYNIPEDYLDQSSVQTKQEMLLTAERKQTAKPGEEKVDGDTREKKTDSEKIYTEFMKGQQRV